MRVSLVLTFAILLIGCGAHSGRARAQDGAAVPDDAELLRVQSRARTIYDTVRAASFATDSLRLQDGVEADRGEWFFTVPLEDGWYSLFGELDDAGTFTPAYAFKAPLEDAEQLEPLALDALPQDFSPLARAVQTSMLASVEAFKRDTISPVVVLEDDGDITVYVLQGSVDPVRYYLGGDMRFRYGPDGRTQREAVKLHQSIFNISLAPGKDGALYQGSAHDHVLFAGPLETELAMVMLYPELGMVAVIHSSRAIAYVLMPSGAIRVLTEAPAQRRVLQPDGTFAPLETDTEAAPPAPSGQVDL
ncbi:hypothetical protein [Myxococcus sp. Y35]|uniref:hypothetical protein n=1 Tax=Pseudomyxococcus flavus TaxID=3115648 RepID=UPI003CEF0BBF